MDDQRFDNLTRLLGSGLNRRQVIRGLVGGAGALAATGATRQFASAQCAERVDCTNVQQPACPAICPAGSFPGNNRALAGTCCTGNGTCCSNNCSNGVCVDGTPPECVTPSDCGAQPDSCTVWLCIEGTCQLDGGCPAGELCCPAQGGSCAPCCDDGDCPAGTPICYIPGDPTDAYCVECVDSGDCGPCESCEGNVCVVLNDCCTGDADCGDCQECEGGVCVDLANCCTSNEECGACQECEGGVCVDLSDCCESDSDCPACEVCGQDQTCHPLLCELGYICCEGHECVHEDECCKGVGDYCGLVGPADGSPQLDCCDGLVCCENWNSQGSVCAECCNDRDCERGVCVEGYCVECHDDWDCGKGEICCDGSCESWECCGFGDEDHCGDCGWCGENYQCYALPEFGEHCEVLMAADGSPEGNCCHGLVCCEWDKKSVCAECCGDWDCPKGCECDHGVCSCHCASDKDCAPGTCCCKSGACSHDCCPKPPKPTPKPPKPAPPKAPVTSLPATGAGNSKETTGLYGAAALGAAAAYLAAKKLRDTPEVSTEE